MFQKDWNQEQRTRLKRRKATAKVLQQEAGRFYKGKKPSGPIVSLDKPYIRPIVRGKEKKSVEFGAKVNKLQVDGVSFIGHLSFDAFNEGTRLGSAVHLAQGLFKTRTKLLGADAIYATNKNGRFVTAQDIKTDFKRKGGKTKHHDHYNLLARMITKERATRLEGGFGTNKGALSPEKNKGTQPKDRNPMDILWNPYLKCPQNRSENPKSSAESSLTKPRNHKNQTHNGILSLFLNIPN